MSRRKIEWLRNAGIQVFPFYLNNSEEHSLPYEYTHDEAILPPVLPVHWYQSLHNPHDVKRSLQKRDNH